MGRVSQVNISSGGVPKLPVPQAALTSAGFVGDWQKNRKHHGGPDRAACLFSEELYEILRGEGVQATAGAFGENITTSGIDLQSLRVGDRLRVGDAVIEISMVRIPCATLKVWDRRFPALMTGRSGWLARVLEPGNISAGDEIVLLDRESHIADAGEDRPRKE